MLTCFQPVAAGEQRRAGSRNNEDLHGCLQPSATPLAIHVPARRRAAGNGDLVRSSDARRSAGTRRRRRPRARRRRRYARLFARLLPPARRSASRQLHLPERRPPSGSSSRRLRRAAVAGGGRLAGALLAFRGVAAPPYSLVRVSLIEVGFVTGTLLLRA